MIIFNNYKAKQYHSDPAGVNRDWWVVCGSEENPDYELKIAKVPHWIRHQKAVAEAIAIT